MFLSVSLLNFLRDLLQDVRYLLVQTYTRIPTNMYLGIRWWIPDTERWADHRLSENKGHVILHAYDKTKDF